MLARLRFDGFVGRDHNQHQVYPRSARQHVFHEALMPGHVHESEAHAALFEERESQINCDSAALLFFQPVRMSASPRLDERRFSMIDGPGGADDDALHGITHSGIGAWVFRTRNDKVRIPRTAAL